MKTIRRLIYGEIIVAVFFVLLAFLALFSFFDLVDELASVGRASPFNAKEVYGLPQALAYVGLQLPTRIYELLPIALLIGTVFVLVRLAQSSEFTILRTSGLGPGRALHTLLVLGLGFVLLTFLIGDYLAPFTNRISQELQAVYQGQADFGRTGAWLRERHGHVQRSVNVGRFSGHETLQDIRIFEFNHLGQVMQVIRAESGTVNSHNSWSLTQVHRQRFGASGENLYTAQQETLNHLEWPTTLNLDMVSVALLKPERMATLELFHYMQHLKDNGQHAQRYEIEFWRKLFYPLSCLVMVILALPFAYLHFRSVGISAYVFLGVMLGISFFLMNNVFGYIGNLRDLEPWLAAAAPSMLYCLASLTAFSWLVLRR